MPPGGSDRREERAAAARAGFDVVRHPDYPRLGWAFGLRERPTVHVGAAVEVFERGLVEGCWAGAFADFDFAGRTSLFGSGVVARAGGWLFCPPCHTLDALYALAHRGRAPPRRARGGGAAHPPAPRPPRGGGGGGGGGGGHPPGADRPPRRRPG